MSANNNKLSSTSARAPSGPPGQVRGAARKLEGSKRVPEELGSRIAARSLALRSPGTSCAMPGFIHCNSPPAPKFSPPPAALLTWPGPPQSARRRASASPPARPLRGSGRRCPGRGRRLGRVGATAARGSVGRRHRHRMETSAPGPPPRPGAPATGKWRRTAARRREKRLLGQLVQLHTPHFAQLPPPPVRPLTAPTVRLPQQPCGAAARCSP